MLPHLLLEVNSEYYPGFSPASKMPVSWVALQIAATLWPIIVLGHITFVEGAIRSYEKQLKKH